MTYRNSIKSNSLLCEFHTHIDLWPIICYSEPVYSVTFIIRLSWNIMIKYATDLNLRQQFNQPNDIPTHQGNTCLRNLTKDLKKNQLFLLYMYLFMLISMHENHLMLNLTFLFSFLYFNNTGVFLKFKIYYRFVFVCVQWLILQLYFLLFFHNKFWTIFFKNITYSIWMKQDVE